MRPAPGSPRSTTRHRGADAGERRWPPPPRSRSRGSPRWRRAKWADAKASRNSRQRAWAWRGAPVLAHAPRWRNSLRIGTCSVPHRARCRRSLRGPDCRRARARRSYTRRLLSWPRSRLRFAHASAARWRVAAARHASRENALIRGHVDAFWRAAAYCLHPKVIALSLLPLALVGGMAGVLGYFFWEPSVAAVRASLEDWTLLGTLFSWLDSIGGGGFRSVVAPLVIVALAVPAFVVASLVVVAWLMTPAMVRLVAARRFPQLERLRGASAWQSVAWSIGCT